MNTIEIQRVVNSDPKMRECSPEVLPIDYFLHKSFEKNKFTERFFICNDEPSNMFGNHWFLVYFNQKETIFLDSLAKSPINYGIHQKLKSLGNDIDFIDHPLQHELSLACGEFCIFFAFHLVRKYSFNQIVNCFSVDTFENERKLRRFMNRVFNM